MNVSSDKSTSALALMRELLGHLPGDSKEYSELASVIAGLTEPDTFGQGPAGIVMHTHGLETAHAIWPQLWARLRAKYAANPLVQKLAEHYDAEGRAIDA